MSLLAAGLMPASPASATTPIASAFGSATGVSVGVTLLSGILPVNVAVPPTPQVSFGPTSTGTSQSKSLLTVTTEPTSNLLNTNVLAVKTGTVPATGSPITDSQSSAEVDGLQVLISAAPLVSADVVKSTCDFNATSATGTTTLVNLSIAGHSLINGTVPPNTVIPILIGSIILNEQTVTSTPNGPEITVNAIHIVLNSPLATGNIIVSQSVCGGSRQATGTLQATIFTCNGSQPGPVANGGSFTATGPQNVSGPNPLSQTVIAGNYTLTATPPANTELVTSCSNQTPAGNTQNVTVPPGGTNTGGNFYEVPTGTLKATIFTCNGSQQGPVANGGSFTATGPQSVSGNNPLSQTVIAGNYTLTATPPAGDEFVTSCSNQTPSGNTANVTVPQGGTNTGGNFFVIPIPANNSANVFVGYADNWNSPNAFFPNPWQGSPNTVFVGSAELTTPGANCMTNNCFDAGAVRVDNTSSGSEAVTVTVDIGANHYALWGTQNVPAGESLVLTQTSSDGTYNFDTSDTQSGCTPSGQIPTVTVSINGQPATTFHDNGQVLDTGGVDGSMCPAGTDEGHAYMQLTS